MSNRPFKFTEKAGMGWVLAVFWLLCSCGCGDFFAEKPTEIQTRVILNELRQIKENPNVKNPLPELYRGPAKKIEVKNGVKLFYFAKHHLVTELAALVNSQFATTHTDDEGKTYTVPDYPVTDSNSTNQLIIHCPSKQEIDKVEQFLELVDVPPIQVNIDCIVLERFADVTMDWETTILIENLFGETITAGGKGEYLRDNAAGNAIYNLLPAFPGASLRESKRAQFGLDFGYWRNQGILGHQFRAVVDMLISRGYLKILMNPTLETVNGKPAEIVSREYAPLEKILVKEGFDEPFSLTDYQWVVDSLKVTPNVFVDGSIGLVTQVKIGSKSKPEGVVQTSIITERSINIAENRIKPGDSLIIGGIRKSEERGVIRGVPFLKDIPIIGVLFSSKDFEEKSTEVIFILTPSISSGGVEYTEMVEDVKEKYAPPKYEVGLKEALTDPFGAGVYTELVEQQAARAEFERFKSDIEKVDALEEVDLIKQKLLEKAEEVLVEKAKAAKAIAEARAAKVEAEKAKAERDKIKVESGKNNIQSK